MIVNHDDCDGGAVILLTPEEVQAITRALAHEAFWPYEDGAVMRELVRGLMNLQRPTTNR